MLTCMPGRWGVRTDCLEPALEGQGISAFETSATSRVLVLVYACTMHALSGVGFVRSRMESLSILLVILLLVTHRGCWSRAGDMMERKLVAARMRRAYSAWVRAGRSFSAELIAGRRESPGDGSMSAAGQEIEEAGG